jgi:hypothetical protein
MLQILFTFLLAVFTVAMSPTWIAMAIFQQQTLPDMPTGVRSMFLAHQKFSDLGSTARRCLQLAIACYNIWFWFKGVDSLGSIETCMPVAFLVVPIHLDGSARRFYQSIAIIYFYYLAFPFVLISSSVSFLLNHNIRQRWQRMANFASQPHQWRGKLKVKCWEIWQGYISISLPKEESVFSKELKPWTK